MSNLGRSDDSRFFVAVRCEGCGAPLSTEKLKCEYCGTQHVPTQRYTGAQIPPQYYGSMRFGNAYTSTDYFGTVFYASNSTRTIPDWKTNWNPGNAGGRW